MTFRTVLVVALALVFGGSAAFTVNNLRNSPSTVPVDTVPVVVAVKDIPRAYGLSADLLKTEDWPKDHVPEGTASKPEDLLGRVTFYPLAKGDPVVESKLCPKGVRGGGLAALIRKGMQCFTIPASDVAAGAGGLIQPEDRVDVLLTPPEGGGRATRLLQNVEILAVGQLFDAPRNGKVDPKDLQSVALHVTPDEAVLLAGQKKGSLQLALRSPQDDKDGKAQAPTTVDDLGVMAKGLLEAAAKAWPKKKAEKPKAAPEPPPEPEPVTINILRGNHRFRTPVYPR